jgi:hypothetical protein
MANNNDEMVELRRSLDALNSSFEFLANAEGFVDECDEYRTLETAIERAKSLAASVESRRVPSPLFKVFTEQRDVFEKHLLPKLGNCERFFLRQVNRESREAIMSARVWRCRVHLRDLSSVSQFAFRYSCRRKPENLCTVIEAYAYRENLVDIVRYAVEHLKHAYVITKGVLNACARTGNFDLFKYAIGRGAYFNARTFRILYQNRHHGDKQKCYEYLKKIKFGRSNNDGSHQYYKQILRDLEREFP